MTRGLLDPRYLGWLGPNGQVVKIQNDGPLGIFQLEYTPETPDVASRRAPGGHKPNIPPARKTLTLEQQWPPPRQELQQPYYGGAWRDARSKDREKLQRLREAFVPGSSGY
ncbi:hypothetical protein GB937_006972 [Aspergillus fischeri]|nr:hypothetical protein GB937_006972 [Aspergillus fischeri]